MAGCRVRLSLAGAVGLWVVLVCQIAPAATLIGDQMPAVAWQSGAWQGGAGQADNLLKSLANEVLASAEMTPPPRLAGPSPEPADDEENDDPSLHVVDGLLPGPASGCNSNSVSQSGGGGSSVAPLANAGW